MSEKRNDAALDLGANDVDYNKAIGADEGGLVDTAVNAIKGVADKIADKLDPLTEQYAGLFKTGLRTPVVRKPSDYGMDAFGTPSSARALFTKDDVEQRAANPKLAVVVDKTEPPELIHEVIDVRTSSADHLGECLLGDSGDARFVIVLASVASKAQESASQTFLSRVEELVN